VHAITWGSDTVPRARAPSVCADVQTQGRSQTVAEGKGSHPRLDGLVLLLNLVKSRAHHIHFLQLHLNCHVAAACHHTSTSSRGLHARSSRQCQTRLAEPRRGWGRTRLGGHTAPPRGPQLSQAAPTGTWVSALTAGAGAAPPPRRRHSDGRMSLRRPGRGNQGAPRPRAGGARSRAGRRGAARAGGTGELGGEPGRGVAYVSARSRRAGP